MEKEFLKKFEGKSVKIILRNNFSYTNVVLCFRGENLVEFKDRTGEVISIEPDFIVLISDVGGNR